MINWLLRIGLVVTPFILAPNSTDIARIPKMAWALCFALAIGLTALYQGLLKPFRNKWTLVLVGFCLVAYYFSPQPPMEMFNIDSSRFWSWQPLYQGLVFLILIIAVASIDFKEEINNLLDIMVWCGLIMSVLVILQSLHLDQIFEHRFGTYGDMCGTLGNPTLVSPWLGMIIPIALYRKRYFFATLMVIACVVTRSDVGLAGMLIMFGVYFALKSKKLFISLSIVFLLIAGGAGYLYTTSPQVRQQFPDNERFLTWGQSINDIRTPIMPKSKKVYSMSGIGQGSFMYVFHAQHNQKNDNFLYAHNDYVQVLYELGIFGLFFFLAMLWTLFKEKVRIGTMPRRKRALVASFVCIAVCAMGSFVFQIGTHIFYALVVVGLLYNKGIDEDV